MGQLAGDAEDKSREPTSCKGRDGSIASCYWKLGPRLISNSSQQQRPSSKKSRPEALRSNEQPTVEQARFGPKIACRGAAETLAFLLLSCLSPSDSLPSHISPRSPPSHGSEPAIPPNDATPSTSRMLFWGRGVGPSAEASANFSRSGPGRPATAPVLIGTTREKSGFGLQCKIR